jgi:putative colanic acid biosynthesis UDP-glucose lipid carrier transferase
MPFETNGLIRPHHSKLAFLHRAMDAAIVALSLYIATLIYAAEWHVYYTVAAMAAVGLFFVFAGARNMYTSWRLGSLAREVGNLFFILLAVMIGLGVLAFLTKASANYSRVVVALWFVLALCGLILQRGMLRVALRELRKRNRNSRSLAIAGAGMLAQNVIAKVMATPWAGLKLAGIYDDRSVHRLSADNEPTIELAGKFSDLIQEARDGKIDYVYVALPMRAERRILDLIDALADTTASVYLVPDVFVADLVKAHWVDMDGMPMVSLFESPFYGVDGWLKRFEDLVLGSLILAVVAVPMLLIAAGVKLTSLGPVLFRQHRYGLNGKVVEVWKFRSMTVLEDGDRVPQATPLDPRITRFGAFLRRTSLDEFPQFINVLQGRMSIVGPRPHAVAHNEQYRRLVQGYMLRHKVKPGITGWAQVNGWRGQTDSVEKMKKRVECDLHYIRNWSLGLDIKIILLTVVRSFSQPSAY